MLLGNFLQYYLQGLAAVFRVRWQFTAWTKRHTTRELSY